MDSMLVKGRLVVLAATILLLAILAWEGDKVGIAYVCERLLDSGPINF